MTSTRTPSARVNLVFHNGTSVSVPRPEGYTLRMVVREQERLTGLTVKVAGS